MASLDRHLEQFGKAEKSDETDLRFWLDGIRSRDVIKEAIELGLYGKTLTVVI